MDKPDLYQQTRDNMQKFRAIAEGRIRYTQAAEQPAPEPGKKPEPAKETKSEGPKTSLGIKIGIAALGIGTLAAVVATVQKIQYAYQSVDPLIFESPQYKFGTLLGYGIAAGAAIVGYKIAEPYVDRAFAERDARKAALAKQMAENSNAIADKPSASPNSANKPSQPKP